MIRLASALAALTLAGAPQAQAPHQVPEGLKPASLLSGCIAQATSSAMLEDCLGIVERRCLALAGETTITYWTCAGIEADAWAELARDWLAALLARSDAGEAQRLLTAQVAWQEATEASCDAAAYYYRDGTIRPVIAAKCRLEAEAQRAAFLRGLGGLD